MAPACVVEDMYERSKRILLMMGWKLKAKSIIPPDFKFSALGVVIEFKEDARTKCYS